MVKVSSVCLPKRIIGEGTVEVHRGEKRWATPTPEKPREAQPKPVRCGFPSKTTLLRLQAGHAEVWDFWAARETRPKPHTPPRPRAKGHSRVEGNRKRMPAAKPKRIPIPNTEHHRNSGISLPQAPQRADEALANREFPAKRLLPLQGRRYGTVNVSPDTV